MAEIFVSHSKRDRDLVDYFARVGTSTKVRFVFEEMEQLVARQVTRDKIGDDIRRANAVFVLLSEAVQNLPHTRDWVLSEAALAASKDVWVFERSGEQGRISIVTPFLRHYVVYEATDEWYGYMREIAESYDDSHVLGTLVVTTGIGALVDKARGAVVGAVSGLAIADRSGNRPKGLQVMCNSCRSVYAVHMREGESTFRCPCCNKVLRLQL